MIEVRTGVRQSDLDAIWSKPREIEAAAFASGVKQITADQVVAGGTLLVDGEPVAAAGIVELAPKFGVVWLTASVDLKPYAKLLLRAMRAGIAQAEARGFRLVGAAPAAIPMAAAFMRHLGFEQTDKPGPHGLNLYERRT